MRRFDPPCAGRAGALLLLFAASAGGAIFTVDTALDASDLASGDGTCASVLAGAPCTLRAAVQEANALAGADRIELPAGVFTLSLAGSGEDLAATGDLDVVEALEISGADEAATILDGGALDRLFDLRPELAALTFALRRLTLRNGLAGSFQQPGGCLRNAAPAAVELDRVTFTDCRARAGGAIYNAGGIRGVEVTFAANMGPPGDEDWALGGAILNDGPGAELDFRRTSFLGNRASNGGAIHTTGSFETPPRAVVRIAESSFIDNHAVQIGGAVLANSTTDLTLANCTFSGNSAGLGGAIGNDGGCFIALHNSTITGNSAGMGGGIGEVHFAPHLIELRNTILAGNSATGIGPDCHLRLHSDGGSLIGNPAGCEPTLSATDLTGVDPLLGPLEAAHPLDRTRVHSLLPGSPMLDSGESQWCPPSDQRGLSRPQDGDADGLAHCDRGAFESAPTLLFHDGFEDGALSRWSASAH
jgi:predicted outer membrane repeat protein